MVNNTGTGSWFKDRAYVASGVWGVNGGYVFHESNDLKRMLIGLYNNLGRENTASFTRGRRPGPGDILRMTRYYAARVHTFGVPPIDRDAARDLVSGLGTGDAASVRSVDIDEDVRTQLEKLGYM